MDETQSTQPVIATPPILDATPSIQPPVAPPPLPPHFASLNQKQPVNRKKIIAIIGIVIILLVIISVMIYVIGQRQNPNSQADTNITRECAPGYQFLFTNPGELSIGSSVALGGTVTVLENHGPRTWIVHKKDDVPQAYSNYGVVTLSFPQTISVNQAIYFDNDPKEGEHAWTVNGISLPTTSDDQWADPFTLNLNTTQITIDVGGDSAHINLCVAATTQNTPIPSPTPTTPPKLTPTPSISCPKPDVVSNIQVTCPACQ